MKKYKRFFGMLAASIMIFSMTLIAGATGMNKSTDEITRGEWIQALTTVFEMEIESDQMPDNYFSDLSAESPYYEDVLLAVEFGVLDIEAGGEVRAEDACTREFAADTLNYCLGFQLDPESVYEFSDIEECTNADNVQIALNRGWFTLIDGTFIPQEAITTEEYNAMLEDAEAVVASVVIDDTAENEYVFADFGEYCTV